MKIAYLDGKRLYRVLYAGIQNLLDEQEYLNKINVYPVPDGDTGTNMAFTLMGVIEGIQHRQQLSLPEMGRVVADSALDNARGNSGVILAQFFQGFSSGIPDHGKISIHQFAQAIDQAVDDAYKALAEPQEGTILTVIREWAEGLKKRAAETLDFVSILDAALESAKKALANTPNLLAVLKDAGVVDAAGQGFVNILEGISDFVHTGNIRDLPEIKTGFKEIPDPLIAQDLGDLEFPFCTECILVSEDIDRNRINTLLQTFGDSIVIAGTKHRAKIHVHTDRPQELFQSLETYGEIHQHKVDDMRQQNIATQVRQGIALVIDSGCDLPPELLERYHIHVVPVRLNFGKQHYIDKVTISSEEFYHKLATKEVHPQTSQPPPADFRRMYQFLATHYESVISLHLPHVLSGTYQNAVNALDQISFKGDKKVIDALSVSAGIGLTAIEAGEAIENGSDFDEVVGIVNRTIAKTDLFIGLESLDAVLRGGRLSIGKKRIIDFLHLNIILTIKGNGELKPMGVTLGRRNIFRKFEKFILKKIRDKSIKRIAIAHAVNQDVADSIKETFHELDPHIDILITDLCPALGAHGGLHAVGVAVQYH